MRVALAPFLVICGALLGVPAMAASWTVVPEESRLGFIGEQSGSSFEGAFERFSAEIEFDPDDLAGAEVVVVIDMASASAGSKDRDSALPQKDWFAVTLFPTARFETQSISKAAGGEGYVADAVLTIRDQSQNVSLPFTLEIDADIARMNGSLTIDRTEFGVGQGQWANADWVAHEVKVTVDLVARRAD